MAIAATPDLDFKSWDELEPEMTMDPPGRWEHVHELAMVLLKTIIFPWGIYTLTKRMTRFVVNRLIFPAQLFPGMRFNWKSLLGFKSALDSQRKQVCKKYHVEHIKLRIKGSDYNAFKIYTTAQSNKWALHANGLFASSEQEFENNPNFLDVYLKHDFNVLLINGPGVGCNSSMYHLDQLKDAQRVAFRYLDKIADFILISGISFGAAAQSEMILEEEFTDPSKYCVLRMNTFSTLKTIAYRFFRFGPHLLSWLGYEMDSTKASKKLQRLKIREIVIQERYDSIIGNALFSNASSAQEIYYTEHVGHAYSPQLLDSRIEKHFFKEPIAI